jgi:hypothetical protein
VVLVRLGVAAGLTACVIGLAQSAATATVAAPRPACVPAAAKVVARTPELAAYTLSVPLRSAGRGLDLWACTSRQRVQVTDANALGSFGAADHQGPGPLVAAGDRLAVAVGSDDGQGLMYSVEKVTFSSRARPGSGVRRVGFGDATGPIARLYLSGRGDVAWSGCIPGTAAPGSPEDEAAQANPIGQFACRHTYQLRGYVEVHVRAERAGRSHLFALGCGVDPNYVVVRSGRVVWLDGGVLTSRSLRSPPTEASLNVGLGCPGHP